MNLFYRYQTILFIYSSVCWIVTTTDIEQIFTNLKSSFVYGLQQCYHIEEYNSINPQKSNGNYDFHSHLISLTYYSSK